MSGAAAAAADGAFVSFMNARWQALPSLEAEPASARDGPASSERPAKAKKPTAPSAEDPAVTAAAAHAMEAYGWLPKQG